MPFGDAALGPPELQRARVTVSPLCDTNGSTEPQFRHRCQAFLGSLYGDGHVGRLGREFVLTSSCPQHVELVLMIVRQLESAGLPLPASILLNQPPPSSNTSARR